MDIIKRNSKGRNVKTDLSASLRESTARWQLGPKTDRSSLSPNKPRRKLRIWKKLLLLFMIVMLLGTGVVLGTYYYVKTAPLDGENSGRVNIMVLGIDKVAKLSDTIMIISLDTRSGQPPKLAMISLPRDLYVDIPEFGGSKINATYSYGENSDYQGGGVALTTKTLETNLNLRIHHYAVLNFNSFKDLVDAAGGVDIEVKTAIDDPFYPKPDYSGVERFSISKGVHHMDGELALKYARSRYTTSDFDRAARQQQVVLAIKDKLLNPETLWHPSRLKKMQSAVEKNLDTDLSLRQLAKLYSIFRKIETGNVTRHVIDSSNYLVPANLGGSSFVPRTGDFGEINQFIDDIFSKSGDTLPEAQSD